MSLYFFRHVRKKQHRGAYGEQLQVINCEEKKLQSLQLPRKTSPGAKFNSDKNNFCVYLVNMISKDCRRASGEQLSSVPAVRKLFNTILSLSSTDKLKCPV